MRIAPQDGRGHRSGGATRQFSGPLALVMAFVLVALAGCGGGTSPDRTSASAKGSGQTVTTGTLPLECEPSGCARVPPWPKLDCSEKLAPEPPNVALHIDATMKPRPDGRTADGEYRFAQAPGTYEVSRWALGTKPTAAQRTAAENLIQTTVEHLRRFRNIDAAYRAGYERADQYHWVKKSAIDDHKVLDPDEPEALVYVADGCHYVLVAALYMAPKETHGPQPGGPLTVWHYHQFDTPTCVQPSLFNVALPVKGRCAKGRLATRSPEMLHVWVDNPVDPFTSDMTVHGVDLAQIEKRLEG